MPGNGPIKGQRSSSKDDGATSTNNTNKLMEYYQTIQNRAAQTAAVINQYIPTLKIGSVDAAGLLTQSHALDGLAQSRDDALASSDAAVNTENQGYLLIQNLDIGLPQSAEGELDDNVPAESALLDLLSPVYAIVPRTTELALERGMKLRSALDKINAYLAAQMPVRPAITSGGKDVGDLTIGMGTQPIREQAVEDAAADVSSARTGLRTAATAVDRLNKRFYAKLQSESRTDDALAAALSQIATDSANLPGTLGIKSILQGGNDQLHLLVNYDSASYDDSATSAIEWQVVGTDADFTNSAPVDPSGNTLGPFAVGKKVNVRTRVTNANGTTTGGVRTITMQTPAV